MVELPHNLREVTDAVVLRGVNGEERYHEKKYGGQASDPVGLLTSSLTKYVFYNWLINNILYLCVT